MEISAPRIFMGGALKAGVNPVSKDEMYLFCLDQREVSERIAEDRGLWGAAPAVISTLATTGSCAARMARCSISQPGDAMPEHSSSAKKMR
jgi:hypothetical protein